MLFLVDRHLISKLLLKNGVHPALKVIDNGCMLFRCAVSGVQLHIHIPFVPSLATERDGIRSADYSHQLLHDVGPILAAQHREREFLAN
jgi:hypothetical protein